MDRVKFMYLYEVIFKRSALKQEELSGRKLGIFLPTSQDFEEPKISTDFICSVVCTHNVWVFFSFQPFDPGWGELWRYLRENVSTLLKWSYMQSDSKTIN